MTKMSTSLIRNLANIHGSDSLTRPMAFIQVTIYQNNNKKSTQLLRSVDTAYELRLILIIMIPVRVECMEVR